MIIKLDNKFGSVLRIRVKIWIPSQSAYAVTAAIFDTGAFKTMWGEMGKRTSFTYLLRPHHRRMGCISGKGKPFPYAKKSNP